jgi:hypothetical protein
VLFYCLLAVLLIKARPGLQYDEALDVRGAVHLRHSREEIKLQHAPDTWFCAYEHCFPLMSSRYTGAIKDYICLPLFALFGPKAEVVRLVTTALGALGILGIATLLRKQVSYAAAAAVAWALAIHPSYLDMTVFDNNVFAPWMAAFGLMCIAASAYLENRNPRTAFWVGVTLGLGIWARANYVWLLAALFLALVISAGRGLLRPFRELASIAVGGILGGLPFLAYQALSGGGTWDAVDMLPVSGSFVQRFGYRLAMLSETFLSDGEHRRIWGGPALSAWQLWLFPTMVALACVLCIAMKQRRGILPRVAALTLAVLTGVFFATRLAIAEHHMVTLVPIAAIVVVLAGRDLLSHRWARVAVVAVAAIYAGSALYWQFATLAAIQRTGGIGMWSDAVFPLTTRLSGDLGGREVKILDWGLENGVYVLSDGRVQTREIFWDANADQTAEKAPWLDEIRRGGVFLLNGPSNRQFPGPSTGFLRALAEGRPTMLRYTVLQRSGVPYAEVIEIVPDSLGSGPTPAPDPVVPTFTELRPADPDFLKESTGFYVLEQGGWRWTAREFSLTFPGSRAGASITLHANVPEAEIQKLGAITLSIRAGAHELAAETFSRAGDFNFTRNLGPGWGNRFDFRVDKTLAPTAGDNRELGIIFVGARLELR